MIVEFKGVWSTLIIGQLKRNVPVEVEHFTELLANIKLI